MVWFQGFIVDGRFGAVVQRYARQVGPALALELDHDSVWTSCTDQGEGWKSCAKVHDIGQHTVMFQAHCHD